MFKSISQLKAANKAAGRHYFSRATNKFFKAKYYRLIKGRFLVHSSQTFSGETRWKVTEFNENGKKQVGGLDIEIPDKSRAGSVVSNYLADKQIKKLKS